MSSLPGSTSNSAELHMPSSNGTPGPLCTPSDAQVTWQQDGYTPAKIIATWQVFAATFAATFPTQLLSQAIWVTNDFPMISNSGQILSGPNQPGYVDVKQAIVTSAAQLIRGVSPSILRLLPPTRRLDPADLALAKGRSSVSGQRISRHSRGNGLQCAELVPSRLPCSSAGYEAILMNGVRIGALWLELQAANVYQYPPDVVRADAALERRNP